MSRVTVTITTRSWWRGLLLRWVIAGGRLQILWSWDRPLYSGETVTLDDLEVEADRHHGVFGGNYRHSPRGLP